MAFIEFKDLTVADTVIATISYNEAARRVELTTKDAKVFVLRESLEEARAILLSATPVKAQSESKPETRLWVDKGIGVSALNDLLGRLAECGNPIVSVECNASNPDKVWWTVLYRGSTKFDK